MLWKVDYREGFRVLRGQDWINRLNQNEYFQDYLLKIQKERNR